jgi:hypothetical protein
MSVVIFATAFSLALTVLCLKHYNIELYSNIQEILDELENTKPFYSTQRIEEVDEENTELENSEPFETVTTQSLHTFKNTNITTPVPVRQTPTPEFLMI